MLSVILLYASNVLSVPERTPSFGITEIFVSSGTNMHFRVVGINSSLCPDAPTWAYINENDHGASSKISTLLTAYAAKKNVQLIIEPVDFYSNGTLYCHIVELSVSG